MLFEGSEKKIELSVRQNFPSLRSFGREKWEKVIHSVGAQVLSEVSNELCDAYLLSESSLFVFDDNIVLITCGRTQMVPAVRELLSFIPLEQLSTFFFQRKNELFPQFQATHFYQDAEELAKLMPGKAFRLGEESGNHTFLFHLDQKPEQKEKNGTFELLMHELSPEIRKVFQKSTQDVRDYFFSFDGFKKYFSEYKIDDHAFDPMGYSLNAIQGAYYFTMHITPEDKGSYASFETNLTLSVDQLKELNDLILTVFQPKSWNVVYTDTDEFSFQSFQDDPRLQNSICHALTNSYFSHVLQFRNLPERIEAVPVELPSFQQRVVHSEMPLKESVKSSWKYDTVDDRYSMGFNVKEVLFSGQSDFQKIEVVDTVGHGRMLFNDGVAMTSEKDEFIYHEMIAHVPFFTHPCIQKVLIIGGGDCGSAREVLRHSSVEQCTMVEIDKMVVDASREFLPGTEEIVANPKLEIIYDDGVQFVENTSEQYDLILVDSTDPVGPGAPLFGPEFYANVKRILSPGGIVVSQAETPFFYPEMQRKMKGILSNEFSKVYFYTYSNLTYPGPLWTFSFSTDTFNPVEDFDSERLKKSNMKFRYYSPEIHCSSFFLPPFMQESLSLEAESGVKSLSLLAESTKDGVLL